jgi:hypothetical protein
LLEGQDGILHAEHSLSWDLHRRRRGHVAQAILDRAVSGNWTKILFGSNSGQIFSNVVTQSRRPVAMNMDDLTQVKSSASPSLIDIIVHFEPGA